MSADISDADIIRLTEQFYARVRSDDLLGPVFNARIAEQEWRHHISKINDFWSSVLNGTRRFSGNPMAKHLALGDITPEHFTRWLDVFAQTAGEILSPEQAERVSSAALNIGRSLQMGMANYHQRTNRSEQPFAAFALKRP